MKSSQDRNADRHHSSVANSKKKNPTPSEESSLITVIISLHEVFKGKSDDRRDSRKDSKRCWRKKKISLKWAVGKCAIQRFVEEDDDSLFTESGQGEKCDRSELLLTGRAPLPDSESPGPTECRHVRFVCIFTWRIRVQSVPPPPPLCEPLPVG